MQLTFKLYLINQRLGLLHCAVLREVQQLGERILAWANRVMVPTVSVAVEESSMSVTRLQQYYNRMQTIYISINDAYDGARDLYTVFIRLTFVVIGLATSINLLYPSFTRDDCFFKCFCVFVVSLLIIPVLLCVWMQIIFRNTKTLGCVRSTKRLHFPNIRLSNATKRVQFKQFRQEQTFDNGYFAVDSTLLLVMFNFVSLFVFSM